MTHTSQVGQSQHNTAGQSQQHLQLGDGPLDTGGGVWLRPDTKTPLHLLGPVGGLGGGFLGGPGGPSGWGPRYPNMYASMTPSLHWSF